MGNIASYIFKKTKEYARACMHPHTHTRIHARVHAGTRACAHLRMCACMRTRVHVRACACMCVHVRACACMCVHVRACACMCVHVRACACMCVHVRACACMCVHVRACACMCVHMRACAYMCMHVRADDPRSSYLRANRSTIWEDFQHKGIVPTNYEADDEDEYYSASGDGLSPMYLQRNDRCFRIYRVGDGILLTPHPWMVYEVMVSTFAWALAFTMVMAYCSDLDTLSETYPSWSGYFELLRRIIILCKRFMFVNIITSLCPSRAMDNRDEWSREFATQDNWLCIVNMFTIRTLLCKKMFNFTMFYIIIIIIWLYW